MDNRKDGCFPGTDRHIPQIAEVKTRCRFAPVDAEFLAAALPKLPCDDDLNLPVTVECNGSIAVRAKAEKEGPPTECVLTNSTYKGAPVRLNTNRKYLARALRIGLHELQIVNPKIAFVCRDRWRSYVWMPLAPDSAIGPSENALRITSPPSAPAATIPYPQTKRKSHLMSETNTTPTDSAKANGQARSNGHARKSISRKVNQQEITALIEQAEAFRTVLRDLALKTNELVKNLKHHRHKTKAIAHTLASLRQLKTIGMRGLFSDSKKISCFQVGLCCQRRKPGN